MQAAKCVLDLNGNDIVDSLDFIMKLKTNPIGLIQSNSQKCINFFKIENDLKNNLANSRFVGRI